MLLTYTKWHKKEQSAGKLSPVSTEVDLYD